MQQNARLTPKGREVMLARLEAGQHQIDVAQAMGISLTTVEKWLHRYRAEGPAAR
jgi:DNA-directed RNA polymerase specialized sigma24 family protein